MQQDSGSATMQHTGRARGAQIRRAPCRHCPVTYQGTQDADMEADMDAGQALGAHQYMVTRHVVRPRLPASYNLGLVAAWTHKQPRLH